MSPIDDALLRHTSVEAESETPSEGTEDGPPTAWTVPEGTDPRRKRQTYSTPGSFSQEHHSDQRHEAHNHLRQQTSQLRREELFDDLGPRLPESGALIHGRYRVQSKLGEGHFGWVFAVTHEFLGQRFAMKILSPRIASDPRWVLRFREEARSTSLIGHDNIVFVTDLGRCPEFGYYFVMEYLDGETLADLLTREGIVAPQRAIRITLSVASALSAVHELGIVHCDLKPGNVMLLPRRDGNESLKVLDFGISSHVLRSVRSSKLYGTPAYMAPEQTISSEVDHRADQFSLACMLYEMICGQRPWRTPNWISAMAEERAKTMPLPPSKIAGQACNPELDVVLMRALHIDPAARWPDIDSFAYALRMASDVGLVPEGDPLDVRLRSLESHSALSPSAPSVVVSTPQAEESMVISVDDSSEWVPAAFADVSDLIPLISVHFRSTARLRREYRRNLMVGGVYVPTSQLLPLHTEVLVRIVYEPSGRALETRGYVVAHGRGELEGFGVQIDRAGIAKVKHFVHSLSLIGSAPGQHDVVMPAQNKVNDTDLNVSEAFLVSRITSPMPLAQARLLFSGHAFDFEEVLDRLVCKGIFNIESAKALEFNVSNDFLMAPNTQTRSAAQASSWSRIFSAFLPPEPSDIDESVRYTPREIEEVLEWVSFFKARHNYMGAIDVLRKALEASPTVAEFYHQLAILCAQFQHNFECAFHAIHRALHLDPENIEYQRSFQYLSTLRQNFPDPRS